MRAVVTTWFGTFLLEDGAIVRAARAPDDPAGLADRVRQRRAGELTPEETEILATRGSEAWLTRDRRLAEHGLSFNPGLEAEVDPAAQGANRESLRGALLLAAESAVAVAWDPSVHVQEAVRAATDLDRVRNLVGERLASWVSRDSPEVDTSDATSAVRIALESEEGSPGLGPTDPRLRAARRRLAELYREVERTSAELSAAVEAATPARAPNLVSLLGPDLTARLLAAAGGLDRLARLPASTVQVLGAERAFFEHLRGHAPPPRHGLLFLHPTIQSSSRRERGKLARALAGKVAIAARRDRVGSPVDAGLARAYESRRSMLAAERGKPRRRPGARR